MMNCATCGVRLPLYGTEATICWDCVPCEIDGWDAENATQVKRKSDGARVNHDMGEWWITRTSESVRCCPSIGPFVSAVAACRHADLMLLNEAKDYLANRAYDEFDTDIEPHFKIYIDSLLRELDRLEAKDHD